VQAFAQLPQFAGSSRTFTQPVAHDRLGGEHVGPPPVPLLALAELEVLEVVDALELDALALELECAPVPDGELPPAPPAPPVVPSLELPHAAPTLTTAAQSAHRKTDRIVMIATSSGVSTATIRAPPRERQSLVLPCDRAFPLKAKLVTRVTT
jgi:hypothetical protein